MADGGPQTADRRPPHAVNRFGTHSPQPAPRSLPRSRSSPAPRSPPPPLPNFRPYDIMQCVTNATRRPVSRSFGFLYGGIFMSEQKTPMDVAENEAAQQSAMAVRLRQAKDLTSMTVSGTRSTISSTADMAASEATATAEAADSAAQTFAGISGQRRKHGDRGCCAYDRCGGRWCDWRYRRADHGRPDRRRCGG